MDQAPRQEIMGYNYASIVVDAGPSRDVRWLLEAARAFAATYGGKLIAVAHAWPRTSLVQETLRPSSILSAQMTTMSLEASLATTRSIYEEIVAGGKVEGEWCGAVGEPLPPLCEHALTADLVIVSNERHEGFQSVDPTEVARRTGTPVLPPDLNHSEADFSVQAGLVHEARLAHNPAMLSYARMMLAAAAATFAGPAPAATGIIRAGGISPANAGKPGAPPGGRAAPDPMATACCCISAAIIMLPIICCCAAAKKDDCCCCCGVCC